MHRLLVFKSNVGQYGYGLHAHVELAIQRYKRIIGSVMKGRFAAAVSGGLNARKNGG